MSTQTLDDRRPYFVRPNLEKVRRPYEEAFILGSPVCQGSDEGQIYNA